MSARTGIVNTNAINARAGVIFRYVVILIFAVNVSTNKKSILLQTANAQVSAVESNSFGLVRILFDTGSQRSYVTNDTHTRLNLTIIRKQKLVIQTFGHYESKLKNVDIVQIKIKAKSSNESAYVEAICVPEIFSPLIIQNIEIAAGQYEHLLNLDFADFSEGEESLEVGVLIGLDFYYSFVSGVKKKGRKGPVAIKSCYGWMLSGSYNNLNETSTNMITTYALRAYYEQDETSLTQVMKYFWNVDSLGVSKELEIVNLQFDGERYVVKLPIKQHHEFLPNNHKNSINRLKSLT